MNKAPTNFSNADFFSTRDAIVSYLSSVHEFKDFNFEGSAISILIDALAYTANQTAIQANMSISEVFLDSAKIRANAVSRAKLLGYFPRQITSSKATLDIEWADPLERNGLEVILSEGARFSSRARGSSQQKGFEFVTFEATKLTQPKNTDGSVAEDGLYTATIDVNEGQILTQTFTYPESYSERPVFEIGDTRVDPDYMIVRVTTPSDDTSVYQRFVDVTDVDADTPAFFLQESERGRVSVYFGDGVVGQEPEPLSTVEVTYLRTSGPEANGSTLFSLDDADGTLFVVDDPNEEIASSELDVTNPGVVSSFGANQETIESIRFTAPRFYASQNRAVTVNDYKALIIKEFGFLESLSVWGGENNNPPAYGRVFICAKPRNGMFISPSIKRDMTERVLDRLSLVTVEPVIVDADPVYADLDVRIQYDSSRTRQSRTEIIALVRSAIAEYFRLSVTAFGSRLRLSRLLETIDDSQDAILGSLVDVTVRKELQVLSGVERDYEVDFGNPLEVGSVRSSFKLPSGALFELSDEGTTNGVLQSKINGKVQKVNVGSVNYDLGRVSIRRIDFGLEEGAKIQITAVPRDEDLLSMRDKIIVLGETDIDPRAYFSHDSLEETTEFSSETIRRET